MAKITTGTTNGDIKITPNGTGKTVVGTGAADATVQSSGNHNLVLQTGNATTGSITITDGANGNIAITPNGTGNVTLGGNLVIPDSGTIGSTSDTDAITIDSSGKVGIATSSMTYNLNVDSSSGEWLYLTRSGGATLKLNASASLVYIGVVNSYSLALQTNSTERLRIESTGATRPGANNTYDLGTSSYYWNDAYIFNNVTTGSDGRQKQDIEELSEAEQRVAIACKGLLRKFRWKDMVAKKGDDARIHFGIIAQDLKAAFEAEGLDAGRYGMFIHSEWWEAEETYTDDDGVEKTRINTFDTEEEAPEGAVKKDRMGIRYSELLAFIIAAI